MLGFGLFIGAVVTATVIGPRAFPRPGAFGWSVVAAGVVAWIAMPPIATGLLDFMLGAVVPPLTASALLRNHIKQLNQVRLADQQERDADKRQIEERRAKTQSEVEAWPATQKGWTHVTRARLMHITGQPKCFFMLSENRLLLRVVQYTADQYFEIQREFALVVKDVISLNVASPTITKTRTKIVPITKIEKQNRSPVARGLVGGALLGPAGVVMGAASGLNAKVTSSVQHERVSESYDALGDPQLIIGTRNPDRPVLKIKFDPPSMADEWMFRIRGAQ